MNDHTHPETELRQHYLFNDIEQSLLDELLQRVRVIQLSAGDKLFSQEETAEYFYYVQQGQIKLSRVSQSGQEKVIEVITSGQFFAEAVMFMQRKKYPVDAEALVDSVVYSISNQTYRGILEQSTQYCFRLLGDLSARLHTQLQEIDHLSQQNATYRLVRYLINQLPPDCDNRYDLKLPIPKQVLASKLSIKPESFSRLLAILSGKGVITVSRDHIVINDVERLCHYE